jgi:hypothetical protein
VLPHENAAAFHEMRAALIAHYEPANMQELQLIDHIAYAQLRMERSRRFENGMFDLQLRHTKREHRKSTEPWADDDTGIAACMCSAEFEQGYNVLFRYDRHAESQYYKSVNALHRVRQARLRREQAEAKRALRSAGAQVEPLETSRHCIDSAEQTPKLASFCETPQPDQPHDLTYASPVWQPAE